MIGTQFNERNTWVNRAIRLLVLEDELDKEANKNFIRENPDLALRMYNILNILTSAPELCLQKNFDCLKDNTQHIKSIADILGCFPGEMRTQDNFETLFQNTDDLDEIKKKVSETMPEAGCVNTVEEINQTRFNEIISEIKKQKTSRPAFS